jgi:hypothetical protein
MSLMTLTLYAEMKGFSKLFEGMIVFTFVVMRLVRRRVNTSGSMRLSNPSTPRNFS